MPHRPESGLPDAGYAPDGSLLPHPISRLASTDDRITHACNGGLPVGRLTEITSTDLSLAVLFAMTFSPSAQQPVLWISPDGSPAPLPPEATHLAIAPDSMPPLLHLAPEHLASVPMPGEILRTLQPATAPSLVSVACLSAIPGPDEDLSRGPRTSHATPAGKFLDSILDNATCPVIAIEPWHRRGPDFQSGPPGPALRSATASLRIRIEFVTLEATQALRIDILHDRNGPSPGTLEIRTVQPGQNDTCSTKKTEQPPAPRASRPGR